MASVHTAMTSLERATCGVPVQLIGSTDDGRAYDHRDAQLAFCAQSPPRFYIMELARRGLSFDRITYHSDVTQCLGEQGRHV